MNKYTLDQEYITSIISVANINCRRVYDDKDVCSFMVLDSYETYPHNSFPYTDNTYDSTLNDVKLMLQDMEVENYLEYIKIKKEYS